MKLTSNADKVAKRVQAWSKNVTPEIARATLEAATTVVGTAKREAPSASGRLRRSITYQVAGTARYIVAAHVPYDAVVQKGITDPVVIRPVNKKALFWKGAAHPFASVQQKKRKGNPYMTRARERSQPQIAAIAARAGVRIVAR